MIGTADKANIHIDAPVCQRRLTSSQSFAWLQADLLASGSIMSFPQKIGRQLVSGLMPPRMFPAADLNQADPQQDGPPRPADVQVSIQLSVQLLSHIDQPCYIHHSNAQIDVCMPIKHTESLTDLSSGNLLQDCLALWEPGPLHAPNQGPNGSEAGECSSCSALLLRPAVAPAAHISCTMVALNQCS